MKIDFTDLTIYNKETLFACLFKIKFLKHAYIKLFLKTGELNENRLHHFRV
jgi:hypothetical protein